MNKSTQYDFPLDQQTVVKLEGIEQIKALEQIAAKEFEGSSEIGFTVCTANGCLNRVQV